MVDVFYRLIVYKKVYIDYMMFGKLKLDVGICMMKCGIMMLVDILMMMFGRVMESGMCFDDIWVMRRSFVYIVCCFRFVSYVLFFLFFLVF